MYQLIAGSSNIVRLTDGVVIPADPKNRDRKQYEAWVAQGNTPEAAPAAPVPTQRELDELRYAKRAQAKDRLIAYMAADNMSRVRAGTWTVQDLTGLLEDPALGKASALIDKLSFELAAQELAASTHPLMTPEIKAAWVARLQEHFYLVP